MKPLTINSFKTNNIRAVSSDKKVSTTSIIPLENSNTTEIRYLHLE